MKKPTINYATAWLMGIDLIATGKQLKAKRRSHSLTQEELSECFEQGGDSASRAVISMWKTQEIAQSFPCGVSGGTVQLLSGRAGHQLSALSGGG